MAITQAGAVGTGATTVYTSSGTTAITCMFFMNDNAAARTLDVHVVQSGGSVSATNKIIKAITIIMQIAIKKLLDILDLRGSLNSPLN